MHCPECSQRVAPFRSWILWPGPTRSCQNCGVRLRYQGFHTQAALYALLTLPLLSVPCRFTTNGPLALKSAAILLALWILAPLSLPWFLARYTLARRGDQLRDFGFALALFVTALTLFYSLTRWQGSRALARAVALLEQKHEPVRLEDLQPPPILEELNVAEAPIFKELSTNPDSARLNQLKTIPVLRYPKPLPAGDPNRWKKFVQRIDATFSGSEPEARESLQAKIAENDPTLTELSIALQRPEVQWRRNFAGGFAAMPTQINATMSVARLLSLRARLRLESTKPAEAIEDCLALVRLTRTHQACDFLIESLVFNTLLGLTRDVITEAISHRAWTAQGWSQLADELDQLGPIRCTLRSLRMERVLQMTVWTYPEMLSQSAGASPAIRRILSTLFPSGWQSGDRAALSCQTQQLIEELHHPESFPKLAAQLRRLNENRPFWEVVRAPVSHIILQPLTGVCESALGAETLNRCAATACRMLARLEQNAPIPPSASDLELLIGRALPTDPLSGAALRYRADGPDTFIIYGTGWNGEDDGGEDLFTPNSKEKTQSLNQRRDWGLQVKLKGNKTQTP